MCETHKIKFALPWQNIHVHENSKELKPGGGGYKQTKWVKEHQQMTREVEEKKGKENDRVMYFT